MNAMSRNALSAYAQVEVETGIQGADPHKLIAMLFEGALLAISAAKGCMLRKEIAAKGAAISKAIAIIDEGLKISLDEKASPVLVGNLKALYEYMCHRLLTANLNNEVEPLDEVIRLLSELKGAWDAIGGNAAPKPAKEFVSAEPPPPPRTAISYGKV